MDGYLEQLARQFGCTAAKWGAIVRSAHTGAPSAFPYVIAIPARDEQSRIAPCLNACLDSMRHYGRVGTILLVVNNTSDQTARVAACWSLETGLPIEIISSVFPPSLAHAGSARRLALDCARFLTDGGGTLLTTDADTLPERGWVLENLRELERNVLVCGRVKFDRNEIASLPSGALEPGRSETLYRTVALELDSLLDPDPLNPWPHHGQTSGASLAMTASSYDLIGGSPVVSCGEDRALARAFREHNLGVLYSDRAGVVTSCRLVGRAQGGMAETISLRMAHPNYLCDEALEKPNAIWRRSKLRAELRKAMANAVVRRASLAHFGLTNDLQDYASNFHSFGALWSFVEKASPILKRTPMLRSEMERKTPRLIALRDSVRRALSIASERRLVALT